jgi:hypothetical protein
MTKDNKDKGKPNLTPAEILRREMAKVRRSTTDINAISNTTSQPAQTSPNPVTQLPNVSQNSTLSPPNKPVSPKKELPRPHQSTSAGLYSSGPSSENTSNIEETVQIENSAKTGKYSYKPNTEPPINPGTSSLRSILQSEQSHVPLEEETSPAPEQSDQLFQLSRRPREGDVDSLFNRLSQKANPNMKLDDHGDPVEKSFERAAEISGRRKNEFGVGARKKQGNWKPTISSKIPSSFMLGVASLLGVGLLISSFLLNSSPSEDEGNSTDPINTSTSLTGSTSNEENMLYLETTEMPNSPAGEQMNWVIRHINNECSELTEHALLTHFSRSVVNRVGYDALINSLANLGRNNAPYTLRGLVEEPLDIEIVGLFDIFGAGMQVLTILIEPEPPYLILELKVDNWP